jgi:hypothetical protein
MNVQMPGGVQIMMPYGPGPAQYHHQFYPSGPHTEHYTIQGQYGGPAPPQQQTAYIYQPNNQYSPYTTNIAAAQMQQIHTHTQQQQQQQQQHSQSQANANVGTGQSTGVIMPMVGPGGLNRYIYIS